MLAHRASPPVAGPRLPWPCGTSCYLFGFLDGFRALSYLACAPSPSRPLMFLSLELEQEADGRWIAEIPDLAGVLAYGASRDEATVRVEALALRVLADRLEHGEAGPDLVSVSFSAT